MSELWPIAAALCIIAVVTWPLIIKDIFKRTEPTARKFVYFSAATGPREYATTALRYVTTLVSRVRLHVLTLSIGRQNGMDADVLTEALYDHRAYMELLLQDSNGHDAPEFYNYIVTRYDGKVVKLARCSSLIRHGIFRRELISSEYDVARQLCMEIKGGLRLAPFFSKIRRGHKQWS